MKAMGGDVGLESVWKKGTLVWFEAPVLIGAGAGDVPAARPTPSKTDRAPLA